jgi:hypothetical protein
VTRRARQRAAFYAIVALWFALAYGVLPPLAARIAPAVPAFDTGARR